MSDEDLNPPTMTQEEGRESIPQTEQTGKTPQRVAATPAFQTSPATVKRRQRHLLERLRMSVSRQPHDIGEGMDKVVFGVAATATIAFVVWGFIDPHGLGRVSKWALGGDDQQLRLAVRPGLDPVRRLHRLRRGLPVRQDSAGRGRRGARVLHRLLGLHDVRHRNGHRSDFLRSW